MIINQTNEATQFCKFYGAGSIGGIQLPNFTDKYVFTRNITGTSDSAYEERMQAYKDYANGKPQNASPEFNKLMKSYVSEVSPERKSLITDGLKAIAKENKDVAKVINFVATVLTGKVVARQIEMCTIYNEAWGEAKRADGKSERLRALPDYLQYRLVMDLKI